MVYTSGKLQFSHCHGNHEITAMTFDPTHRRLLTAGKDGTIKIWNFNNGALLDELQVFMWPSFEYPEMLNFEKAQINNHGDFEIAFLRVVGSNSFIKSGSKSDRYVL